MTKSEQRSESIETNKLLAFIAQNELVEGDKLPPERELATELGISRRALRHLLTKMELDGLIWRGRRNGTFLGRRTVGQLASTSTSYVEVRHPYLRHVLPSSLQ